MGLKIPNNIDYINTLTLGNFFNYVESYTRLNEKTIKDILRGFMSITLIKNDKHNKELNNDFLMRHKGAVDLIYKDSGIFINKQSKESLKELFKIKTNGINVMLFILINSYEKISLFSNDELLDIIKDIHFEILLREKTFCSNHDDIVKKILFKNYENVNQYIFFKLSIYYDDFYTIKNIDKEINESIIFFIKSKSLNIEELSLLRLYKGKAFILDTKTVHEINKEYRRLEIEVMHNNVYNKTQVVINNKLDAPFTYVSSINTLFYNESHLLNLPNYQMLILLSYITFLIKEDGSFPLLNLDLLDYSQRKLRGSNKYTSVRNKLILENYGHIFENLYNRLCTLNIDLAKVIDDVINDKIKRIYNIDGFKSNLYIKGSYRIKCEHLFSSLESLVRQFKVFQEHGTLSNELLLNENDTLDFSSVKSYDKHKYVYINEDNYETNIIVGYLFSEMSPLLLSNYKNKYISFVQMISKEKISILDIPKQFETFINDMIDKGVLYLKDKIITPISNSPMMKLFEGLYYDRFISLIDFTPKAREIIIDYINGCREKSFGNTLFSKFEVDFLNYNLKSKGYDDSLHLRNIYAHGQGLFIDEDVNRHNYIIGLSIYVRVLVKIIEELEYNFEQTNL